MFSPRDFLIQARDTINARLEKRLKSSSYSVELGKFSGGEVSLQKEINIFISNSQAQAEEFSNVLLNYDTTLEIIMLTRNIDYENFLILQEEVDSAIEGDQSFQGTAEWCRFQSKDENLDFKKGSEEQYGVVLSYLARIKNYDTGLNKEDNYPDLEEINTSFDSLINTKVTFEVPNAYK